MVNDLTYLNPKELVVDKNSRFRADANLSELMESIKQNGILQPIVARTEDKVVICGNRRLAAAIKLQLQEVPVRLMSGIGDKELLILNLTENMQRQDITSIEVGRICDGLLKNTSFKISQGELASSLGVSQNRIKICLQAFYTLPAEFRERVVHMESSRIRRIGDLPENVVACILNFGLNHKKISNEELKYLLKKASEESMSISKINLIGRLYTSGMPLKKAFEKAEDYVLLRLDVVALKTELENVLQKERCNVKGEALKKIIKEKYPSLLF